jgi:hypothetical protein
MRDLLPAHLIHLFRSVPSSEAARTVNLQHGLVVAQNVSNSNKHDIAIIRSTFNHLKNTILAEFEIFERRLVSIEERVNSSGSLLEAMDEAISPMESEFSGSLANNVTDMEDIDHQ